MARRTRRRPARSRSRRRRAPRRLTPLLLVLLLGSLGAVALERGGVLPEPVTGVVREVETAVLAPLLRELGLDWPGVLLPPPAPRTADERAAVARAIGALDAIPVEPEHRAGYAREDWPHWRDEDGDCLDTRDEVLAAESLERVRLSPGGCSVVAGRWQGDYTGETVTDPGALDVDHLVPLQEAHDSGGWNWDRGRRAAYANDFSDPRTLIAVTAGANRSKGAQGPEDWLPPDPRRALPLRRRLDAGEGAVGSLHGRARVGQHRQPAAGLRRGLSGTLCRHGDELCGPVAGPHAVR